MKKLYLTFILLLCSCSQDVQTVTNLEPIEFEPPKFRVVNILFGRAITQVIVYGEVHNLDDADLEIVPVVELATDRDFATLLRNKDGVLTEPNDGIDTVAWVVLETVPYVPAGETVGHFTMIDDFPPELSNVYWRVKWRYRNKDVFVEPQVN